MGIAKRKRCGYCWRLLTLPELEGPDALVAGRLRCIDGADCQHAMDARSAQEQKEHVVRTERWFRE